MSTQITDQLKYQVVSGIVATGHKLPSVRALAEQLSLNPTTVARVYRQLEAEGVIYTQPGSGTFVSGRPPGLTVTEQRRRLEPEIRQLIVEAASLGTDLDRLLSWVQDEVKNIRTKRG